MIVLGIDPGTTESGWCILVDGKIQRSGVWENTTLIDYLRSYAQSEHDVLAVEMIASYGMPVGREVFETCVWIGRFVEAWESRRSCKVKLVTRKDAKMALCGDPRAKDTNIRQRLIDLLGKPGTKASPGPTYGVKSHAWPAVAVALVASGNLIPWSS